MNPSSPPPAPNPTNTIAATAAANAATATRNQKMNALNQSNPFGSVSTTYGPEGNPIVNWGFSSSEAPIYDVSSLNRLGAGGATIGALGNVATDIGTPVDTSAIEGRLGELASSRLDPALARRRAARETQLYAMGAHPGTEAWDNAEKQLAFDENDARTQLLLQGNQQAYNQIMGTRAANLGTLGSLFGLGQPVTPTWTNQPQYNEAPVDVAGITQQGYQNQLLPWQTQENNRTAMLGGLAGLAGTVAGAALGGPAGAGMGGWAAGKLAPSFFGSSGRITGG